MLMLVVSNGTIATCSAMLLIFKQVLSEFLRKKEEKMQFYPQLITLSAFSSYLQGEHGNTSLLPHSGDCSFLVEKYFQQLPILFAQKQSSTPSSFLGGLSAHAFWLCTPGASSVADSQGSLIKAWLYVTVVWQIVLG